MNAVMNPPLATGQCLQERRTAPPIMPPASRADQIIAEGDRKRHAYRCMAPNADTAMVYGAQIGHLHGEVRRLCNELEALNIVRDSTLDYLTVDSADFAVQLVVGYSYQPGQPANPTSAYTYEQTGNPGDDGCAEELELQEVWVNGCELVDNLSDKVTDSIIAAVLNKLHLLESKAREQDEPF